MNFKDKVVIVTGASSGIGKAIALAFGKQGANVVVNYLNDKKSAEQVVTDIEKNGGKALAIKADVSQEDQVKKMVKEVVDNWRKVDVLVNNAGILVRNNSLQEIR